MRGRLLFGLVLALACTPIRAQVALLTDDREVGLYLYPATVSGKVFGFTPGAGLLSNETVGIPGAELAFPLFGLPITLSYSRIESTNTASGIFAFHNVIYPAGATVQSTVDNLEFCLRFPMVERPHMRLSWLASGRIIDPQVQVTTAIGASSSQDWVNFLPALGALLEAKWKDRTTLFGLFKYGCLPRDYGNTLSVQGEGGIAYMLQPPKCDYVGWRLATGYRYLELHSSIDNGLPKQASLNLVTSGAYVSLSRVF